MRVQFNLDSYRLEEEDGNNMYTFEIEVAPEDEKHFRTLIRGLEDFEELQVDEVDVEGNHVAREKVNSDSSSS